jgi:hypothetical protein
VALAAVVAVEAASLESDPYAPEDLFESAATIGALGEGLFLERLHDFEVLPA